MVGWGRGRGTGTAVGWCRADWSGYIFGWLDILDWTCNLLVGTLGSSSEIYF